MKKLFLYVDFIRFMYLGGYIIIDFNIVNLKKFFKYFFNILLSIIVYKIMGYLFILK